MHWTLVISFFRYLEISHLHRCLKSLAAQTVKPERIVFFDNNSDFGTTGLKKAVLSEMDSGDKVEFYYCKHGRKDRTLSWANNAAIRMVSTEHFIFTRCDFEYAPTFCEELLRAHQWQALSYATSWMKYGEREEKAGWQDGPSFCTSKMAMELAGWYDETLIGWGFDQQDLQTQMMRRGVKMKVVEKFLALHMDHPHDGRNVERAKEIWAKSPRRVKDILEEEKRLIEAKEQK